MQNVILARVLEAYGLRAAGVLPSQKGYRNESHPVRLSTGCVVNVILYKQEPDMAATIRRVHAVSTFLHKQGFPVRASLDRRCLQIRSAGAVRYVAVYNYLSGYTLSWDAYTQKHLKLLGKTMSDLHAVLAQYPTDDLPNVADQYREIYRRMQCYFGDDGVARALHAKLHLVVADEPLAEAIVLLKSCRRLRHHQALHMDLVRGNILFTDTSAGTAVSGILDLEKVAAGHPLFDVARTLAFLLVDCKYKAPFQVRKYFLYSGYQKRGATRLARAHVRRGQAFVPLLDKLLGVFLLYDFYKFLRHNPYESLAHNEHFVRTRDLLLERGMISPTAAI